MKLQRIYSNAVAGIRKELWVCLFLSISTVSVYWKVHHFDFIAFDDPAYVSENPQVQGGLSRQGLVWSFTTFHKSNWHPLTWLSHMLDVQLYGINPGAHHLTNLQFHLANTLMLFLLLGQITGALWRSAFVAALFALHPLHVESVVWIAERKDVLSTFFWILALLCYTRYVGRPAVSNYLAVFLCLGLGLMAKPMLVTVPLVLLLLDYWPFCRFRFAAGHNGKYTGKKHSVLFLIYEKIPFFVLAAASSLVAFFVQHKSGAVAPLEILPINVRILNALISYVSYIRKMFWPNDLTFFYPYIRKPLLWQIGAACIILISISLLVIRTGRRQPFLVCGWLWYLITLIPVIGLVQVGAQAIADRYTYVPLIGLFIMIAWGVPELFLRWQLNKTGLMALGLISLAALMVSTWLQVRYWQDSVTLFKRAFAVTEDNYPAHYNLGVVLSKKGGLFEAEAISHYKEALRINPGSAEAHNNLGIALKKQGRLTEAVSHYEAALQSNPDHIMAHNNLGNALVVQGRLAEAIKHYSEAVRLDPLFEAAHINLRETKNIQKNIRAVVRNIKNALKIDHEGPLPADRLNALFKLKAELEQILGRYQNIMSAQPGFAVENLRRNDFAEVYELSLAFENFLVLSQIKRGKSFDGTNENK